jgi:hypothetical protein
MEKDKQQTIPNVLKRLAHLMGTEIKNRRLEIPEKLRNTAIFFHRSSGQLFGSIQYFGAIYIFYRDKYI